MQKGSLSFRTFLLLLVPLVLLGNGTSESLVSLFHLESINNIDIVYYEVTGNTAEQLRSNMHKLGPTGIDGRRSDAYTRWKVEWRWPKSKSGAFIFDKTKVTVSHTITLPGWVDKEAGPKNLQKKWHKFMEALYAHEYQHVKNGERARDMVEEAIYSAASQGNLTPRKANKIARSALKNARARDRRFDEETNHGMTQGVRFP